MKILIGIAILIALVVGTCCVDLATGEKVWGDAVVLGKSHTAATTGTGVGPATGGGSGVAVVVTTTPEQWTLILDANGSLVTREVSPTLWASVSEGDTISIVYYTIGGLTGLHL